MMAENKLLENIYPPVLSTHSNERPLFQQFMYNVKRSWKFGGLLLWLCASNFWLLQYGNLCNYIDLTL